MDKIIEKNPKIKSRILYFIDFKGITKTQFCNQTGISYSNIKGNAQKSELGGEQISKILEVFGELSPDWLLLGKGEMLRNSSGISQPIIENESAKKSPDILIVEIELLRSRVKEQDAFIKILLDMLSKSGMDCSNIVSKLRQNDDSE